MVKIADIKYKETKLNIETYEANMKILFKKIKIKSQYDIYYYKSLLKNKKIYDIIEEDINIYIYYDPNENIDDILFIEENQESILKGHCEPISQKEIIELFKKEDAMCKIKELDYTCIEIYDEDGIKEYFKIDNQIIDNSIEIYNGKEMIILQYPKENPFSFSEGIIL